MWLLRPPQCWESPPRRASSPHSGSTIHPQLRRQKRLQLWQKPHLPALLPPVAAAPIAEPPIYDASTDIATIPRPPADWSADQLANAEIWLTQSAIIGDCMLEKGYEYHFTPSWQGSTPWKFADHAPSEALALWGPTDRGLGDDYDWRDAGCQGYAVHVTGMDDAH